MKISRTETEQAKNVSAAAMRETPPDPHPEHDLQDLEVQR